MKVMLTTLPDEGQTVDYTTASFHRPKAVKYMPLGILAVASGISPRHEVCILDTASKGLSIRQTLKEIDNFQPDVLGISAVTRKAWAMSEILHWAKVPLKVVGGPHTTHYALETLKLGTDAVFIGDGDYSFGRWLNHGDWRRIIEEHISDINQLPFPQYEALNLDDYALPEEEASDTLFKKSGTRFTMFSSRGCPYRCVFCDVQEKKFRCLSAQRVVDEMEHLLSLGASSIHIMDDSFNVNRNRVLEICAEIKRRGLQFSWSARGRAEVDAETAQALSEAGCKRLHVGIESLDNDVLRWMNKKMEVKTIKDFCATCREFEIEVLGYFVIGAPVETREYRQRLPEMIKEFGITYPYFNLLYPSPHTEYYESLLQDGTYKRDYWQDFGEHPTANYELPLPRPQELQDELLGTLDDYIGIFYKGDN